MPKNAMRPIHPGEVLREEFLVPMALSAHALAQALRVPATRIGQTAYDLRAVSTSRGDRIAREVLPRAA